MVKIFMVNCDIKWEKLVKKYVEKCVVLKKIVFFVDVIYEEKIDVVIKLVKLLCDLLLSCQCNCCELLGCLCGVYSKFGFGCNKLCEVIMCGDVLGLCKVSW